MQTVISRSAGITRRRYRGNALAAGLALFFLAILHPGASRAAEPVTLSDVDGRRVTITDTSRVVSIGGEITEIIYALGAERRLIAVDTTSRYPPAALKKLPDVGYMRRLSAEGILSLRPTLVLAVEDSGPPSQIKLLQHARTAILMIPKDPSLAGVSRKISLVGKALSLDARARRLAAAFQRDMAKLTAAIKLAKKRPKVLFLLSIGRGAPLASGRGTAADGIIRLAGGANAITGYELYKPLSPEAVVAAGPEVILVTRRTVKLMGGRKAILNRSEIRPTPAGRNRRIIVMDGLYLLGFGPRTAGAVRDLARALHPELYLPAIETAEAVNNPR